MSEEIKNTKDLKYKSVLLDLYIEKRDGKREKEEDGWCGYDSAFD